MRRPTSFHLIAIVAGLVGCEARPLPPAAAQAPVVCDVSSPANACLSCQARHCGGELDRCHGAGFHEGRSVQAQLPEPPRRRCEWDPQTQDYTKDCTWVDAAAPPAPGAPCLFFANCIQQCGCASGCATSCRPSFSDNYYSNDPRLEPCDTCLAQFVTTCSRRFCASECAAVPDAAARD